MLARGAQLIDVSAILGHSSQMITARIYARAFEAGKREAINRASAALFREGA